MITIVLAQVLSQRPSRSVTYALAFFLGSLGTAAFAAEQPAELGAGALTPEQIYVRSVRAMKAEPQPPFVTFRESVVGRNFRVACVKAGIDVTLHHGDASAAFDVWFRTSDGSALSRPVDTPSASPCPATLLVPLGSAVSSLGIPQPGQSPAAAPATAPPDSAIGPPIIGAVHVDAARYYHIDLAGMERLGASDAYHLKLRALRDPQTHPLTDLFIDPQTFLVREARGEVSGHYVLASGRLAGIVDFNRFGGYWLVEREHFDIAANALFVHARMTITLDGSNFATPSELPGIAFPTPQPTASPKAAPSPIG